MELLNKTAVRESIKLDTITCYHKIASPNTI